MLEPEMLAALACGAVLPYVGVAIWSWAQERRKHH